MVDQRPDKDAREKAKQTIRAAFATGKLIEADHDQRLQAVDNAQSAAELAMITQGLDPGVPDSWRTYQTAGAATGAGASVVEPPASPTAADSMEPPPEHGEPVSTWVPEPPPPDGSPHVPYGGGSDGGSSTSTTIVYAAGAAAVAGRAVSRVVGTVVAIVVALVVGAIGIGISGGVDELFDGVENIAPGSGSADVQSADGFAEMLEDLEDHKGSTEVFEATLYPEYAIVYRPVDADSARQEGLMYRGSWDDWTTGRSTYERFDLSVVDGAVLEDLCDRAKAELIEDPGPDCYIIIKKPTGDDKTWLSAYVSNEFQEGGYLGTDLKGKETFRATWPE